MIIVDLSIIPSIMNKVLENIYITLQPKSHYFNKEMMSKKDFFRICRSDRAENQNKSTIMGQKFNIFIIFSDVFFVLVYQELSGYAHKKLNVLCNIKGTNISLHSYN